MKINHMEILNCNERQGKSIQEIEGSYKMIGLSLLFFVGMMAYTSLTKSSKGMESAAEKKTEMHLVKN